MQKYLLIGIGGALGAITRALIMEIPRGDWLGAFPINTLIINISGSFLLAFFLTLTYDILELDAHLRLAIASGFLAAFTTFSTICQESVLLILNNNLALALSYLAASLIIGLGFAYLGLIAAKGTIAKLIQAREINAENASGGEPR